MSPVIVKLKKYTLLKCDKIKTYRGEIKNQVELQDIEIDIVNILESCLPN